MKKRILHNFLSVPVFMLVTVLCILLPRKSSAASLSKFPGILKGAERPYDKVLSAEKRHHRQKRRIGVRIPHLVRKEPSGHNGGKRRSSKIFQY